MAVAAHAAVRSIHSLRLRSLSVSKTERRHDNVTGGWSTEMGMHELQCVAVKGAFQDNCRIKHCDRRADRAADMAHAQVVHIDAGRVMVVELWPSVAKSMNKVQYV